MKLKHSNPTSPSGINPQINLISEGTRIKGEVNSKGDIRVDGEVDGIIHSEAKVVIGSTGLVEGDVYCTSIEVLGRVEGTLQCKDVLLLKASARVSGDIVAKRLVVEDGAMFNGNCSMDSGQAQKEANGKAKQALEIQLTGAAVQ
jgi:cytoskeletal protein CcmA (bactofilin family)